MYDIKEKINEMHKYLDMLKSDIEKNEIDGLIVITCKKNDYAQIRHSLGDVSCFEWIGILDYAKDVLLSWYDEEFEDE